MGFSISWLAVKTDDLDQLFEIATVAPTTEADEWLEADFSGSGLQDGWYLFQAKGCDHPIISDDSLSKISTLGETVACSVEEHVMVSVAEGWNDGMRSWSIAHNAQEGMFDLSAGGRFQLTIMRSKTITSLGRTRKVARMRMLISSLTFPFRLPSRYADTNTTRALHRGFLRGR